MNKRQQETVDWIIKRAEELDFHSDEYEFKKKDVTEEDRFVAVVTEVGRIGDEGTMAEVFARTKRIYFVGPRGGIRGYDGTKDRWVKGRKAIFQYVK